MAMNSSKTSAVERIAVFVLGWGLYICKWKEPGKGYLQDE